MKRYIYFLLYNLIAGMAVGQVTVVFPVTPGQYTIQDLAQTTIINATGKAVPNCYLNIVCNNKNGTNIFELHSSAFLLQQGSNMVGLASISDAQVVRSGPIFADLQQSGSLPQGSYSICINVYQLGGASLGTGCQDLAVINTQQFYLLSPFDQQVVYTVYPNFNWITLNEKGKELDVKYAIRVCQLNSGQNYAEAIGQNVPVLYEQNLTANSLTYPVAGSALDTSQKYVWQVEATITSGSGQSKLSSEIWMFQFANQQYLYDSATAASSKRKNRRKKDSERYQYVYLTKNSTGSVYVFTKKITFRYDNEAADAYLNFALYERGKHQPIMTQNDKLISLQPRVNYLALDVTPEMSKSARSEKKDPGKEYILEIKNSRKETVKMRFTVAPDKTKKS